MEILRFDEAPNSAPHRKKSSQGMLVLGLVAALFGVGSAFASTTIEINGGGAIDVGQGVSLVTACDSDNLIDIRFGSGLEGKTEIDTPTTTDLPEADKAEGKLKGKPVFYTNNIVFSKVDATAYNSVTGFGCGGEYFDLQVYYKPGAPNAADVVKPFTCGQLGLSGEGGGGDGSDDAGVKGSGYSYLDGDTTTVVTCSAPGTVSFKVPTFIPVVGDNGLNRTFTLSLGKKRNSKTLLTALDISYFTLVSRHS